MTFDGSGLSDVIGARGQVSADGGWPTCSVFVTAKPSSNEEKPITVVAGAGNNTTRFTGVVRRFRPSGFPKGVELVATGTLAYAAEWAPDTDLDFLDDLFDASGATDQEIIRQALDLVPQIGTGGYTSGEIDGTGIVLGLEAPEAFDWKAGTTAWSRIQSVDKATLYRTYQTRDGSIKRIRMIGHPDTANDFTLAPQDILDGATGSRDTERTRNAVVVHGHDYGDDQDGPVLGFASGIFTGYAVYDGSDPTERFPEVFTSDLIEDGNDDDGNPLGYAGIDAQDVADAIKPDVLKEFVDAEIPSWRDDTHGPGLTCLLDCLARLAIGEPMWVRAYAWEVGDKGWQTTYTLHGGGLQAQTTPEV